MSTSGTGQPALARNIGLFALIVYGVGDMVGTGIYATISSSAELMGNAIWISFAVAMAAALFTGLSYASLSSRYPRAGGASYVVNRAYQKRFLAYMVGLAVTASGMTSMAAGSNAFAENLGKLLGWNLELPETEFMVKVVLVCFLLALVAINFIGIKESLTANLVFTAVEVGGLLLVIVLGARFWGSVNYLETPPDVQLTSGLVLTGAVLAFYGFIGFEDMFNVAEEVKNPEHTMPWGIIIAIVVTTVIYMLISITVVSVVPAADLADGSKGVPFSQVMAVAAPWIPGWVYGVITVFAVANTALLNYIMGSRLLYGMARQGLLPRALSKVHPKRRTPWVAILVLAGIVLVLAFIGNVGQLASATSLLLLSCFCVVNAALITLKLRKDEPKGKLEIPIIIPLLGILVCVALIFGRVQNGFAVEGTLAERLLAPLIALGMIVLIGLLYVVLKPKALPDDEALED